MIEPKVRLTLHLPPALHALVREAAQRDFSKPARRAGSRGALAGAAGLLIQQLRLGSFRGLAQRRVDGEPDFSTPTWG